MAFGQAAGELVPTRSSRGTTDAQGAAATGRVIVVGAGIAGLACALACVQAGAQVEVLEARASTGHLPAHIDVVPNLLRDLARLGVAEACVRRGFAYSELALVDESGGDGLCLPAQRLAGPQLPPAAGIALDDLLDILAAAAVKAGAVLRRGCAVHAVEPHTGRVLADGRTFEADLIVLATGADSPLVDLLFGPPRPGAVRHGWWHALLPRPTWLDRSTWMAGSVGRRLLLVPIGMSRAGVAVVGTPPLQQPADGAALARLLASWGPLPRRIAELMDPSAPTVPRVVATAMREGPWHRGAVLCVGAAVHSIAPPFGQSAAQAVEDAIVLGELLAERPAPPLLLQRFMARRTDRVRRVHGLTERAALWMLHPEPATDLTHLADEINALVAQPA